MLTTPKYRKLTCLYLLTLLLDDAVFVALILTLFIGENSDQSLEEVLYGNIKLFAVVALEVFYDVCHLIVVYIPT